MKQSAQNAIPKSMKVMAWILVLGSMAPMLDATMVNIAIHQLRADFDTSLAMVQWTITGFALAMGAAVPFSGWLINRFSGKQIYLWAEIAFGITSLLSGLAWHINVLIGFRLLQGFAAGLILPLLTTLLVDAVGPAKMGRIMAIVGVPMTLGPMLGPIIGGFIVQYSSWRWIFFINVPLVIIAAILLVLKIPQDAPKNPQAKLDYLGVTLLAAIASTIIYGVVQASSKGSFNNPQTLIYIGIGLVLLLIYSAYAHRHEATVVLPLNLFRHKNFTGSMLGLLLAGFITSGPMILLPLFFQDVRGQSVILAAIALIPQSLGMLLARGSIGRLVDKIGARWVVIASVFVTILGTAPFIYFDQHSPYLLIALVLFIRGIGGAGIVQPLMSDPFIGLAKSQTAQASIGTRMMQQVGGGFGSAFLATIVASYTASHHVTNTLGLTSAYQQAFLWSTVLIIVILIPAMLLTNKMKLEIRELN